MRSDRSCRRLTVRGISTGGFERCDWAGPRGALRRADDGCAQAGGVGGKLAAHGAVASVGCDREEKKKGGSAQTEGEGGGRGETNRGAGGPDCGVGCGRRARAWAGVGAVVGFGGGGGGGGGRGVWRRLVAGHARPLGRYAAAVRMTCSIAGFLAVYLTDTMGIPNRSARSSGGAGGFQACTCEGRASASDPLRCTTEVPLTWVPLCSGRPEKNHDRSDRPFAHQDTAPRPLP